MPTRVSAHQIHMVAALIGIYPWDAAAYLIWKVRVTQGKIENVTILGTILMYTIFKPIFLTIFRRQSVTKVLTIISYPLFQQGVSLDAIIVSVYLYFNLITWI